MTAKLKLLVCCLWVIAPTLYCLLGRSAAVTTSAFAEQKPTVRSGRKPPARRPQLAAGETSKIDFRRDIEPIFETSCRQCHSGDKANGELRLDDKTAALSGGVSGRAIIPGNGRGSLLLARVLGHGGGMRMPPGKPLTERQIDLLRIWIDEGAVWPDIESRRSISPTSQQTAQGVDFIKEVEPIFKAACYQCHGPDLQRSQLRLDTKAAALRGGISGPVIIPGDSGRSRLFHRVSGAGDEPQMPFKQPPLSPRQIAVLRDWIDQGANWPEVAAGTDTEIKKHWAYVKPLRPQPPAVKHQPWLKNPIDSFILARLEKEKLTPAREASRETLIRRVSLDLTGLPPSIAEIDEFLADHRPDAYERMVDRLLASPHYGERWARWWLDLARYADTNGYEKDLRRSIWKYRDWVIDALNKDMPFDRFTIEQLAGDMLPGATTEQIIASGFNRNTMFNQEGGVDQQEALFETIVDRVNTTATVWLGSTLACAQCHNHKYDPFTQKDYYRLYAFFNNNEYTLEGNATISEQKLIEPVLELPTPAQAAERQRIEDEITRLREQLRSTSPQIEAAQAEWETAVRAATADWVPLDPDTYTSTGGATLTKAPDKSILVSGTNASADDYVIEAATELRGITGIRIEALPDASLPRGGPGRDPYGNFSLDDIEVRIAPRKASAKASLVAFKDAAADDSSGGVGTRGGASNPFQFKGWTIDATKENTRLPRQLIFVTAPVIGDEGESVLRIRLSHSSVYGGQGIGRFRLSVTTAAAPILAAAIPAGLRPILDAPLVHRTKEQRMELDEYYRSVVSPALRPARERLAELRKAAAGLGILSTLVMRERQTHERPSAPLRIRGSFTNPGEKVYAGVPAVLHPLRESELPNRLGLARWLVDADNPLVARVTINRVWEQIFGRGLVETSEDFGTQGERPTHPELLDWLAVEFAERDWSVKNLVRLIVTSATYRQASEVTPLLRERDPYNRLLARGPRFRMEAEMVRDTALVASGLINRRVGGPSVFPYQPDGIWDIPYNSDKWTMSEDADRYRRALYTFIRRTSPYPAMVNFDAPSREFCTVRRVRTNTPLQALTTLNDPAFFEMARRLAHRIVVEGGAIKTATVAAAVSSSSYSSSSALRERVTYGFRLCVGRRPKEDEVAAITAAFEKEVELFKSDESAAAKITGGESLPAPASAAEYAAWIVISNVLLNLDETITKE